MAIDNPNDYQTPGALPSFGAQTFQYVRPLRGIEPYAGDAMANVFGHLGQQFGVAAARSANYDAAQAGHVAGLDPNYTDGTDGTAQGLAFRQAAETTHGAQAEILSRGQASQVFSNYQSLPPDQQDPTKLQSSLEALRQNIVANHIFPDQEGQFNVGWGNLAQGYVSAAQNQMQQRAQQVAKASALSNITSAQTSAQQIASQPGVPGSVINTATAGYDATVDQAVNLGHISPVAGQALKADNLNALSATQALTAFRNLPPGQRPAAMAAFSAQYSGATLPPSGIGGLAGTNNNPTNIRAGAFASNHGATGANGGFAAFTTPDQGLRAASANLDAYNHMGINTIGGIISRWSPGSENDTPALIANAAQRLGVNPDTPLNMNDPNQKAVVLHALVQQETGKTPWTVAQISDAINSPAARMDNGTYLSTQRSMGSQIKNDQTQALHQQHAGSAAIDSMLTMQQQGYPQQPGAWNNLQSQLTATGDPVLLAKVQQGNAEMGMLNGFRGQSPSAISASLDTFAANAAKPGWNPQSQAMYQAGLNYLNHFRSDLAKDPLGRAAREGVISGLPPLDMSSPTAFYGSLQARVPAATTVQQAYGLSQTSYTTPAERAALQGVAANGGAPMVQMAGAAAQALGPKLPGFLREIGGSAPQFAQMAILAAHGGDVSLPLDAAWTIQQDHQKGNMIPRPKSADVQGAARTIFGNAFNAIPIFQNGAMMLASNAIAAEAFRNGENPNGSLSTATSTGMKQALQKSVGATYNGTTRYGGVSTYTAPGWGGAQSHVLLPNDVRGDSFADVLGAVNDADLKSMSSPPSGTDGSVMTAQQLRNAYLTSVGFGRYQVSMGDPASADPRFVHGSNGARFVLDLNTLAPALRARVPQAYRNGVSPPAMPPSPGVPPAPAMGPQ